MKRIVCIGNRYFGEDDAGPAVYDRLARLDLPEGVQAIDGGLGGLNLLDFLEDAETVVFVDQARGFGRPGEAIVLTGADVAAMAQGGYDHAAGLPYLLRMAPKVCENPAGRVFVLGLEGVAGDRALERAAHLAVRLAVNGRPDALG